MRERIIRNSLKRTRIWFGMRQNQALATLLSACTQALDIDTGKVAVDLYRSLGWNDSVVSAVAINMLGKCGCLSEARAEFDRLSIRDERVYDAMACAMATAGTPADALSFMHQMR